MNRLWVFVAFVSIVALASCGGGSGSGGGKPPAVLQSIVVTPASPSVAAGLGVQFAAAGHYSDDSTRDLTRTVTWSSSNTNVATISSTGGATTKTTGSTTITATSSGISGTTTLTVTPAALASITVSPASTSIPLGTNAQFTATGIYTDKTQQDLTNSATWASSSTLVASVSSTGLATSNGTGSAVVTASMSGITGGASLTVTAPGLVSITVSPANASIAHGTNQQFTATGTFTDGSLQNITSSVTWTSSNTAAASINLNGVPGLAHGIAAGVSTITAASGTISATANLTVTGANLASLAVTPATVSIPLGKLQQFTATGTFDDQTTQNITDVVTWSSSSNAIASITVSGLATGRSLGTATITAAFGTINGTAAVTVDASDLVSLSIDPADPTIAQTTSLAFSAIGTFTDGSTHDLTLQCTWTSSNPGVAKVSNSRGLVKGVSPGTATITATLGSVNAKTTITVTNATIVSITVTPAGKTIAPGTQLTFTATGVFSDASTQVITRDATWASDNPAVATLTPVSIVTGVSAGTANISATFNGVTGSTPITVSGVTLTSITVSPDTAALAPASTLNYSAQGTFSDGTTQIITSSVTWSSSAPSVASITNFGQVTGQSPGIATITAQFGSVAGTAVVVVESSPLVAVQVTPATAQVAQQTGIPFHATGVFADGSMQDLTVSVFWSSSPASVATISNAAGNRGLATGVKPGTATITALFAGLTGTASLTVTNATMTSLTINPSSADIPLGTSQQFVAIGNFDDGTNEILTTQVAWTSSNVNVAPVSATGLATSAGVGTTTIGASMLGVNGTAVLTVH